MNLSGGAEGGHARCDDLAERIERFIDGELDATEAAELDAHLAECLPCLEERGLRERIRGLLRDGCAEVAPPELVARVRARLATSDVSDAKRSNGG